MLVVVIGIHAAAHDNDSRVIVRLLRNPIRGRIATDQRQTRIHQRRPEQSDWIGPGVDDDQDGPVSMGIRRVAVSDS